MDCSPPGFSVHRIPQARILERAAVPSSRGSSRPSDWTCVSCLLRWQMGSVPLAPPGKPLWLPYTIAIPLQVVHIREIKMYVHTETCTQMVVTVFFFYTIPKLGTTQMTTNRWTDQQSTHQPISLLKNANTWRNLNYHSIQKGLYYIIQVIWNSKRDKTDLQWPKLI